MLSIAAIVLSIAFLSIDSYFRSVHERDMGELASKVEELSLKVEELAPEGSPQFSLSSEDLGVYRRYTRVYVINRGDGPAHNVRVGVRFLASDDLDTEIGSSQFVPEIQPEDYAMVLFPIGEKDLESAASAIPGLNVTDYEADVFIECNEIALVERHYIYTQFSVTTLYP